MAVFASPMESANVRLGRAFGPVLLLVDGVWVQGGWDGRVWYDDDDCVCEPTAWRTLPIERRYSYSCDLSDVA